MSDKLTNEPAAGDAEPGGAPTASPETNDPAETASAGDSASSGDPGDDEIAIEVETDSPGEDTAASDPDDGEIPVEVDTHDSDAAERIAQLEAEKADIEKQRKDSWERLLRATADLENFRKRARRDIEDTRVDSRTKVLRPMLEVIDNLERAVDHAESVDNPEKAHAAILEGVKLVLRQFSQVLERFDVKPVPAVGEPFDPTVHEAISQVESAEFASGSVINAPQKGYTIGDRLLRPSLVVVSKGPPAGSEPAAAPDDGDHSDEAAAGSSDSSDPGDDASGQEATDHSADDGAGN